MRIKAFTDGACSLTIFSRRGKYDLEWSVFLDIIDMQSALHQTRFLSICEFFYQFRTDREFDEIQFLFSQFLKFSLDISEIKY